MAFELTAQPKHRYGSITNGQQFAETLTKLAVIERDLRGKDPGKCREDQEAKKVRKLRSLSFAQSLSIASDPMELDTSQLILLHFFPTASGEATHRFIMLNRADKNNCRDYGNKSLGEVTLDQAYGGARGVKCLVWEVSCTTTSRLRIVLTYLSRGQSWILRRVSASVAALSQSANKSSQKLQAARSLYLKASSGCF